MHQEAYPSQKKQARSQSLQLAKPIKWRLDSNIKSKSSNNTYLNEEQSFDRINMTE